MSCSCRVEGASLSSLGGMWCWVGWGFALGSHPSSSALLNIPTEIWWFWFTRWAVRFNRCTYCVINTSYCLCPNHSLFLAIYIHRYMNMAGGLCTVYNVWLALSLYFRWLYLVWYLYHRYCYPLGLHICLWSYFYIPAGNSFPAVALTVLKLKLRS